jgi:hypothetical protein
MNSELATRFQARLLSGIAAFEERRGGGLRDLWRAALDLEHVILSDLLDEEEEAEVLAGIPADRIGVCQEIFCALETLIERSFACLALDGCESMVQRADGITENYLTRYEELARREVALAGITASDQVRFIGSGPFPITGIEYARRTGCSVECVDFVPEAVETSRAVLARLGLTDRLTCVEARGEDLPAPDRTVVLVGVLARPKQEIFRTLEATCPEGCRILARTTFGLRGLIYHPAEVEEGAVGRLRRTGRHVARGDQILSSHLYVKSV